MSQHTEENPIIVFTHSGRTGGDDFGRILQQVYHKRCCIVDHTLAGVVNKLRSMPLECSRNIKVILGHGAPFGIHNLLTRSVNYLSFLRDPIERVISQYYVYKNDPSRGMHAVINRRNISLGQYAGMCPNEQAHYLIGSRLLTSKTPNIEDREHIIEILDQHFSCLGITHRYDESIFLMRKALGWKQHYFWSKTLANNNRPRRGEVCEKVKQEIEKHNTLDRALFEYACTRFEKEIETLTSEERVELSEYRKSREIYMKLCSEIDRPIMKNLHRVSLQKRGQELVVIYHQDLSRNILEGYFEVLNNTFHRELKIHFLQYPSQDEILTVLAQNRQLLAQADFLISGDVGGVECLVKNAWLELGEDPDRLTFAFLNEE